MDGESRDDFVDVSSSSFLFLCSPPPLLPSTLLPPPSTLLPELVINFWPIQVASLDVGKGIFKVVVNIVKKGEVAMKEKRGKEVPWCTEKRQHVCLIEFSFLEALPTAFPGTLIIVFPSAFLEHLLVIALVLGEFSILKPLTIQGVHWARYNDFH